MRQSDREGCVGTEAAGADFVRQGVLQTVRQSRQEEGALHRCSCAAAAISVVAAGDAALFVCLLLLHRIPIAMKLSAEQYKLCARFAAGPASAHCGGVHQGLVHTVVQSVHHRQDQCRLLWQPLKQALFQFNAVYCRLQSLC